ncbi:hypothetical protein [Halomonas sp. PA16-9]|uniref:hypothetical protein n=1 Tax=Halomonas sp. PA16-9 TaxID=2576841 RepID=UPI0012DA83B7|nr:hypothetical protein FDY98_08105 [Halomonas sp. PA16-9]
MWLERELEGVFENYHVVRLPGLFGVGLKKNILFDLLCENILEKINLKSSFQWYPLSRVWQDIETIISNNLPLVNLAVEPISNFKIKEQFFNDLNVGCEPLPEVHYDMHTSFSGKFKSQHNNYLLTADEVLNELSVWLEKPEVKCE